MFELFVHLLLSGNELPGLFQQPERGVEILSCNMNEAEQIERAPAANSVILRGAPS